MMVDSDPTDRTDTTDRADTTDRTGTKPGRKRYRQGPVEDNAGWTIFSYLISGMVVYGLIGWLVSRLTHIGVLFPLGMIVGLVLAIVLIILRYGRP
jgi:ATP synthase protein I